jgi:hypothetical protein
MSSQNVIVYISREGTEMEDLAELINGDEIELQWVGTLNGEDVPLRIRLAEEDPNEEDEHGLAGLQRERYDALMEQVGDHDAALADARLWPVVPYEGHDYEEYDSQESLRDHLLAEHGTDTSAADNLYRAGSHHLRTMHRMLHHEDPEGD